MHIVAGKTGIIGEMGEGELGLIGFELALFFRVGWGDIFSYSFSP